jgi:hypothetical protein
MTPPSIRTIPTQWWSGVSSPTQGMICTIYHVLWEAWILLRGLIWCIWKPLPLLDETSPFRRHPQLNTYLIIPQLTMRETKSTLSFSKIEKIGYHYRFKDMKHHLTISFTKIFVGFKNWAKKRHSKNNWWKILNSLLFLPQSRLLSSTISQRGLK